MDCKSLIGSYISSDQPGEFKWQPGSLTQAVLGGLWVVFEEIDKAPNKMQSIILPLLDGSSSFVTGHGEVSCLGFSSSCYEMENCGWDDFGKHAVVSSANFSPRENCFGIDPFFIKKGHDCKPEEFEFWAPTTLNNASRVLRAMQLPRPVLLEGSPGVGKTSLVVALAQYSGKTVVRINLSEQTDMMDLLGSDLPVESIEKFAYYSHNLFSWVDGILLQALKNGYWVLLDELNLAPQSILEGLNAILDHRAEVYIPELDLTFKCPEFLGFLHVKILLLRVVEGKAFQSHFLTVLLRFMWMS